MVKKKIKKKKIPYRHKTIPDKRPVPPIVIGTVSVVTGWFLGYLLWEFIVLSYKNPDNITGPLTILQFNPSNNILRYLIFIFLPSLIYLIIQIFIEGSSEIKKNLFSYFNLNIVAPYENRSGKLDLIIIFILSILIYNIISHTANQSLFPLFSPVEKTVKLDIFHEGEFLTPAFNYISGKGVYKGSFIAHGAFYDGLSTVAGWKLFDKISIGASRQFNYYLTLVLFFSIIIFIYSIYYYLLAAQDKNKAFIHATLISTVYILTWTLLQYNNRRDTVVFLGLSLILFNLRFIITGRRKLLLYLTGFLSGIMSPIAFFYSIDKGFYYTAFLLFFILFSHTVTGGMLRRTRVYSSIAVVTGMISGSLLFLLVAGKEEMQAFMETVGFFSRNKDLIDSFIYPKPFTNFDTVKFYTTFPLIAASSGLIVITSKLLSGTLKKPDAFMYFMYTFLGLIYFRSGLGRSDNLHVMYSSTFLTFILVPFIMESNRFIKNRKIFMIFCFCTLLVFPICFSKSKTNIKTSLNFSGFFKRLVPDQELIQLPDDDFLPKEMVEVKSYLKKKMGKTGQNHFLALTSEAGWPYLLRVPSTNRFFLVWFAMPEKYQNEVIKAIGTKKPQYLIVRSDHWAAAIDKIKIENRIPKLFDYVLNQYKLDRIIHGYEIYKIR